MNDEGEVSSSSKRKEQRSRQKNSQMTSVDLHQATRLVSSQPDRSDPSVGGTNPSKIRIVENGRSPSSVELEERKD